MKRAKRINRYNWGRYSQYITYIVLGVMSTFVVVKTGFIIEKITVVELGKQAYQDKDWLKAEETLYKAGENDWFYYEEDQVNKLLKELAWITENKKPLEQIDCCMSESKSALDYEAFLESLVMYENLNIVGLEDWQRQYLLEAYPVESKIHSTWKIFKEYMEESMHQIDDINRCNWAKEHIFDIPENYFETAKQAEIEALFKASDIMRFEKIEKETPIFKEVISTFNDIYALNKSCGYDTNWLKNKVQSYVRNRIAFVEPVLDAEVMRQIQEGNPEYSKQSNVLVSTKEDEIIPSEIVTKLAKQKQQIATYVEVINLYKSQAHFDYYDQDIENGITHLIEVKDNEIQTLINAGYYEQAIELCKAMKELKNYDELVTQIECIKEFEAPWTILMKESPSITSYHSGSHAFGVERYVLAFDQLEEAIKLYLLTGSKTNHTINKITVKFADMNISSDMLSNISDIKVKGQLIFIVFQGEGVEHCMVLSCVGDNLYTIFDEQGDEFIVSEDLKQISVINPMDAVDQSRDEYCYDQGAYIKESNDIANESEMLQSEIYIGQYIETICFIDDSGIGSNQVIAYYCGEDGCITDAWMQLNLTSGEINENGYYSIIGTVVGTIKQYDAQLEQEVTRPIVEASWLEKQEGET